MLNGDDNNDVDNDDDDDDDKEECWLCPRVEGGEEEGTGPGSSPPTQIIGMGTMMIIISISPQIIGMTTMMMIISRPNHRNGDNLPPKW